MKASDDQPDVFVIIIFAFFILLSLSITYWAARRTRSTDQFYTAGRKLSGLQNGLALAGDYMSAAAFLGASGLVALSGFDGMMYAIGGLVGWPIVVCLIAEPLRNLGRYTFSDVVAYRLRQTPVRIASAISSLAVTGCYLIAQMVGAGYLVRLLFGLSYELAILITAVIILIYVLFGGMVATSWVQIIKATLMLVGSTILAVLVLARFGFNPLKLFDTAARINGAAVLGPGGFVSRPIDSVSLGLALMFGTAGLPHILMRFYTVPDSRAARSSVGYGVAFMGYFHLLVFVLGFGAMVILGRDVIRRADPGGNMAAPLLAEVVGGRAFFGFIAAVAFATILAVVSGLALSGAAALSHDIWVSVVRGGKAPDGEQLWVARVATVLLASLAVVLGIIFKGQNVANMVGLAFSVAASANFPALVLSIYWKRLTTLGALASMIIGGGGAILLILLSPTIQVDILKHGSAWFPLRNPAIVTMPLSFLAGIGFSLLRPEPSAQIGFLELEQRLRAR
jgi:cation/acetate symporter